MPRVNVKPPAAKIAPNARLNLVPRVSSLNAPLHKVANEKSHGAQFTNTSGGSGHGSASPSPAGDSLISSHTATEPELMHD